MPAHRRRRDATARGIPNAAGSRCPSTTASPTVMSANLAMIRFPATGDKIGSLVDQPRRPGRVGHRSGDQHGRVVADAGPRAVRPRRLRSARGGLVDPGAVVQLRRRQRPAARRPRGGLHPRRRRAHRERDQGVHPALRRQDGQRLPGQRRHRERRQGSRRHPRRDRRRQADLPRLLLRHPDRCGLRRGVPAERARDDSRRCRRPQRRPDRGRPRPGHGLPEGVRRLRRRLRQILRLPAGHRSGESR